MRKEEIDKILKEMSDKEKYKRTSVTQFRKRWTFIKSLSNQWTWYYTQNEMPHEDREDQTIIRYNHRKLNKIPDTVIDLINQKTSEGYEVHAHWDNNKSVPQRFHFHIYKRKNTD